MGLYFLPKNRQPNFYILANLLNAKIQFILLIIVREHIIFVSMKSSVSYDINGNSGYLLLRAGQYYRQQVAQALKPLGLSHTQFFIIMAIWYLSKHQSVPTQVQVAEYAACDINVTSQVVRRLIGRGLVSRKQNPIDSRAYLLELTCQGESVARSSGERITKMHQELLAHVDVTSLNDLLQAIIKRDER